MIYSKYYILPNNDIKSFTKKLFIIIIGGLMFDCLFLQLRSLGGNGIQKIHDLAFSKLESLQYL